MLTIHPMTAVGPSEESAPKALRQLILTDTTSISACTGSKSSLPEIRFPASTQKTAKWIYDSWFWTKLKPIKGIPNFI